MGAGDFLVAYVLFNLQLTRVNNARLELELRLEFDANSAKLVSCVFVHVLVDTSHDYAFRSRPGSPLRTPTFSSGSRASCELL